MLPFTLSTTRVLSIMSETLELIVFICKVLNNLLPEGVGNMSHVHFTGLDSSLVPSLYMHIITFLRSI